MKKMKKNEKMKKMRSGQPANVSIQKEQQAFLHNN